MISLKAIENEMIQRLLKFDEMKGLLLKHELLREIPLSHSIKIKLANSIERFSRYVEAYQFKVGTLDLKQLESGVIDPESIELFSLKKHIKMLLDIIDLVVEKSQT